MGYKFIIQLIYLCAKFKLHLRTSVDLIKDLSWTSWK